MRRLGRAVTAKGRLSRRRRLRSSCGQLACATAATIVRIARRHNTRKTSRRDGAGSAYSPCRAGLTRSGRTGATRSGGSVCGLQRAHGAVASRCVRMARTRPHRTAPRCTSRRHALEAVEKKADTCRLHDDAPHKCTFALAEQECNLAFVGSGGGKASLPQQPERSGCAHRAHASSAGAHCAAVGCRTGSHDLRRALHPRRSATRSDGDGSPRRVTTCRARRPWHGSSPRAYRRGS